MERVKSVNGQSVRKSEHDGSQFVEEGVGKVGCAADVVQWARVVV